MAKPKKTFAAGVGEQLERAAAEPNNVLREVLRDIPVAGDDFLLEIIASTSDRTVDPAPLAVAHILPSPDATDDAPLPEDLGEEVPGVTPEYIRQVEDMQRRGKTMEESERVVRAQVPVAPPPAQNPGNMGYPPPLPPQSGGGFWGGSESSEYQQSGEPQSLSPLDVKLNAISADQIVKWYDIFQSIASVWGYDHFSNPKQAGEVMEALMPKVTAGTGNAEEVARYRAASEVVLNYTVRKTRFAESVAMSEGLKQDCSKLLGDILEARGVKISPELLLFLLFMSPLIVNGGRILLEKMGFADADKMVGQFSAFVGKQTQDYNQNRRPQY